MQNGGAAAEFFEVKAGTSAVRRRSSPCRWRAKTPRRRALPASGRVRRHAHPQGRRGRARAPRSSWSSRRRQSGPSRLSPTGSRRGRFRPVRGRGGGRGDGRGGRRRGDPAVTPGSDPVDLPAPATRVQARVFRARRDGGPRDHRLHQRRHGRVRVARGAGGGDGGAVPRDAGAQGGVQTNRQNVRPRGEPARGTRRVDVRVRPPRVFVDDAEIAPNARADVEVRSPVVVETTPSPGPRRGTAEARRPRTGSGRTRTTCA